MAASPETPASRAAGLDGEAAAVTAAFPGVRSLARRAVDAARRWGGDAVGRPGSACVSAVGNRGPSGSGALASSLCVWRAPATLGGPDGWGLGSELPKVWGLMFLLSGPFLKISLKYPRRPAL